MSDVPSYPREASEREAEVRPAESTHEYAGWWSRAGATLLDGILVSLPFVVILFAIALAAMPDNSDDGPAAAFGLVYLLSVVIPFVYFTVMHGGERGQTLGKRATNIRVVATDGSRLGYGRAFGRYAIMFVFALFALPLLVDYLWPLWDDRNQSLHDKVAGSLVVRA